MFGFRFSDPTARELVCVSVSGTPPRFEWGGQPDPRFDVVTGCALRTTRAHPRM